MDLTPEQQAVLNKYRSKPVPVVEVPEETEVVGKSDYKWLDKISLGFIALLMWLLWVVSFLPGVIWWFFVALVGIMVVIWVTFPYWILGPEW